VCALDVRDQGQDIWIWDLDCDMPARFTFGPSLCRLKQFCVMPITQA
jgi:hypothetical protein